MSDLISWLHEFADACEIVAAGRWPGPRTAARLREVADALAAAQQPDYPITATCRVCDYDYRCVPVPAKCEACGSDLPPSEPVEVDAPGSRAWMAEVCRVAALSLAAHGVRNDQLAKVANWIAQQPAAEPRSTHRAWRRNDWLLSYFEALSDHHIDCEQPAAADSEENQRTWQALWLVLNQTGTVVVPGSDIVSADWSRCQIEQTVHESTGAVRFRAILLADQPQEPKP